MYTVFDKLYMARLFLSLNLRDIATQSGITKTAITLLERGERENIPSDYIKFLYEKGIDINWIFNDCNNINTVYRKDSGNNYNDLRDVTEQLKKLNLKLDKLIPANHLTD